MIRVIEPSLVGLKSLHDFERLWGISPSTISSVPPAAPSTRPPLWDVATLAVAAEYRSAASAGLISMALYQAINMLGAERGRGAGRWPSWTSSCSTSSTRPGTGPSPPIEGTEPLRYLDSPASLPVFCDVIDYRARLSFLDPATHAILFEGKGLESMVSSPEWRAPIPVRPSETGGRLPSRSGCRRRRRQAVVGTTRSLGAAARPSRSQHGRELRQRHRAGVAGSPAPDWHPSSRRRRACSSSSTPSATVAMLERVGDGHHRGHQAGVGVVLAQAGDEGLVDLDLVHGQPVERRQRRVARAEVVDRDAHAARAQRRPAAWR